MPVERQPFKRAVSRASLVEQSQNRFEPHPGEFRRTPFVHRRGSALPRLYLTGAVVTPKDGETVLQTLCTLDPKLACAAEDHPFEGGAAYQELAPEWRAPWDLTVRFTAERPGVVVLAATWHPEWRAESDGREVPLRRVNHAQVGIPVDAGEHALRIHYHPWDFLLGLAIATAAWLLLLSAAALARLKRPTPDANPRRTIEPPSHAEGH